MAASVDLKELAALPGFGNAKKVLINSGNWDEHAGSGPERAFTVTVNGRAPVEATLHIKARNHAEAEEKAENMIDSGLVKWSVDIALLDIDDMDVVDSKGARE